MAKKDDRSGEGRNHGGGRQSQETYYVVNNQKIKVSQRNDLVAVVYDARSDDRSIKSLGRTATLEPASEEFPDMQQGNVRIFRMVDGRQAGIEALQEAARDEGNVEKVGLVYTNQYDQPLILTDEMVVKFKSEMAPAEIEETLRRYGLEIKEPLGFVDNGYVLRLQPRAQREGTAGANRNALEVANDLLEEGYADFSYANWIEHVGYRHTVELEEAPPEEGTGERHGVHPTDPMFAQQWHHENTGQVAGGVAGTPGADIRTPLAWQITMGNPAIRVAVIDGGTDIAHGDLNAPGKNVDPIDLMATPPDSNPVGSSHGTQVAGMAVASANNGVVGAGSAPNCRLIAIKAGDTFAQVLMARAFVYAADHGADVITCSLGPNNSPWVMTDALRLAIDYATTHGRRGRGCAYFHAVDNANVPVSQDQVCSYERTTAVGRTNNRDRADGSAFGPELDISAPGANVLTTTNTTATNANTSTTITGTSFAAPLTAGVGALVLSVNPNLSWEEVRQVILDGADKIDAVTNPYTPATPNLPPGTRNDIYGYGRVNARNAVIRAQAGSTRDLHIRDTVSDSGAVPQPATGFWNSPDIWVRNADDGGTTHQNTIRGRDNFIFARVWNRGSQASLPAWVRFIITSFAGTQFRYPFDYKRDTTADVPGGTPGNLRPAGQFPTPGSYLVGEQRVASIPAGGSTVVRVRWPAHLIPPAQNWHPCLLVDVSPHDGPPATGQYVWENNNLAQKNITIVDARRGQRIDFPFRFGHPTLAEPVLTLQLTKSRVPESWKVGIDLKDQVLLKKVAAMGGIAIAMPGIHPVVTTPVLPENTLSPDVLSVLGPTISPLRPRIPWRVTFLEEARLAVGPSDSREDDSGLVFTFSRGSSVEIGRAPLSELLASGEPTAGAGGDAAGEERAAEGRKALTVENLDGAPVLALRPGIHAAKFKVPVQPAGEMASSVRIQVPEDATPGQTMTVDVAQYDRRGTLVGGVRLQVNVIA